MYVCAVTVKDLNCGWGCVVNNRFNLHNLQTGPQTIQGGSGQCPRFFKVHCTTLFLYLSRVLLCTSFRGTDVELTVHKNLIQFFNSDVEAGVAEPFEWGGGG
jgi:hypothetical protein